jgi:hypothetical protein
MFVLLLSSIMGSLPTEMIFWWSVEPDMRFMTWRPPSELETDTVDDTVAWILGGNSPNSSKVLSNVSIYVSKIRV